MYWYLFYGSLFDGNVTFLATQSTAQADTQIPRFMAFLQKRKAAEEKPVTPGLFCILFSHLCTANQV